MSDVSADTATIDKPDRWLITGTLPCLKCQYNIRGLVGPVVQCPECGHHNDLRKVELWQLRALPLGVREREHWPTTAAALTIAAMILFSIAAVMTHSFVTAGVVTGLLLIPWLYCFVRWVRSCNNPLWAIMVFVLVHVTVWSLLTGIILIRSSQSGTRALGLVGIALGTSALVFRRRLFRTDKQDVYRDDWRSWRVPVGDDAPTLQ